MNRLILAISISILAITILLPVTVNARTARIIAQITPDDGLISDAAMLGDGHFLLLYPNEGKIADYTLDGTFHQHITREGGLDQLFRPTSCVADSSGRLLVFDEASHKVLFVNLDGNIIRGIDLAFPDDEGNVLALSKIGDLAVGTSNVIWAMLPERNLLSGFDNEGNHVVTLDLKSLLPYTPAMYSRPQMLTDGSLFILDYHQGAILYRRGSQGEFRRIRTSTPDELNYGTVIQDFAVDDEGNILMATFNKEDPLLLLTLEDDGYHSHKVELELPSESNRLACRWSGGKFIVWTKEKPLLTILELLP